jgi:hypothetical protein
LSVPELIKGKRLKIRREARRRLTESELAAVEVVSERVVAEIDRLKPEGRACSN